MTSERLENSQIMRYSSQKILNKSGIINRNTNKSNNKSNNKCINVNNKDKILNKGLDYSTNK